MTAAAFASPVPETGPRKGAAPAWDEEVGFIYQNTDGSDRAEEWEQQRVELLREKREIERDLIERELCRRELEPFVARMQSISDPFVPGWHVSLMCKQAEKTISAIGDKKSAHLRLIAELPPRHAKSHTYSKCLPLWYVSNNPTKEVIVCGYGQEFINEFGDWVKNILDHPEYQSVFPDVEWRYDSKAKNKMLTKQGGGIRFVGAGAGITGRGAHLFIIDDPIKGVEDADSSVSSDKLWAWYWSVARTRLAPGGAMIVLHTRWRENDLIGRLLVEQPDQWQRLHFPAIAVEDEEYRKKGEALHPGRYDLDDLAEMRDHMPAREWNALYQQNPVPEEGTIFKRHHFQMVPPEKYPDPRDLHIFAGGDYATSEKETADFTCVWPFGVDKHRNIWFLPQFIYGKFQTGESIRRTVALAKELRAQALHMEKGVITNSVRPLLELEFDNQQMWLNVISPPSTKDKVTRARAIVGMMEFNKVFFPQTRWVETVALPQLLGFPFAAHDDIVDAVSIAGQCLTEKLITVPSESYTDDDEDDEEDDIFDDMMKKRNDDRRNPFAAVW